MCDFLQFSRGAGSGARSDKDIVECPVCEGRGIRLVRHQLAPGIFQQVQMHCDRCQGRGRTIKHLCSTCRGHRIVDTQSDLVLHVDRGLPEGSEIVFEGEADEAPDVVPGDVVVRVRSKRELGGFMRKESNLYWKEVISVKEVRELFPPLVLSYRKFLVTDGAQREGIARVQAHGQGARRARHCLVPGRGHDPARVRRCRAGRRDADLSLVGSRRLVRRVPSRVPAYLVGPTQNWSVSLSLSACLFLSPSLTVCCASKDLERAFGKGGESHHVEL